MRNQDSVSKTIRLLRERFYLRWMDRFAGWAKQCAASGSVGKWMVLGLWVFGLMLYLVGIVGCETVYVDGVAKWRFRREYQGAQSYPPRFAPYDEPVFNYDVRWDPKQAQVAVCLHPVKSIGALRPQTTALAELSHDKNAPPCANCNAQYAAGGKARLSRKFVFGIPENQPGQINQIYFFKVQYWDDAGAEQTEMLFFYDAKFYPVLVNYYETRKARLKRLSGSKKYKINGGKHEPMKMILMGDSLGN